MIDFFCNFDWNGFWLNFLVSSIFFIIGFPVALKLIPNYTVNRLKKKNKNYINRKISSVIQETCDFILSSPFKDKDLNRESLSVFSDPKDLKHHRFIGLSNINIFNPIVFPKIKIVIIESLKKQQPDDALGILEKEKIRLSEYRNRVESILDIHSMHVDDETLSEISNLCLEVRSFELKFKYNYSMDDLIESGKTERIDVWGISELSKIYEQILELLKVLLGSDKFKIEIDKNE